MPDFDQSGINFAHGTKVYLGPSLGWVQQQIKPETFVTAPGTVQLSGGAGVILVKVAGLVTILLPDVATWVRESAYFQATAFERAIWIKDLGGNASAFNITVTPFGAQQIDGVPASYIIIQNFMLLRLYPLFDFTGWYSA